MERRLWSALDLLVAGRDVSSAAERQEALVSEEAVHGGIRLTTLAHEASKSDDVSLAVSFALSVNLFNKK